MRTVCVYCGSNSGADPAFLAAAQALGTALAKSDRALIYGGAKVGLMGALADTVLSHGGRVIGVMPRSLVEKEIAHAGLTELHIVASMHERKTMMADLADGFIAMPGGLGTLEELFEVWTWAQLGFHDKPIGLLGPEGFFAPLLAYLDQLVAYQFLSLAHRQMIAIGNAPGALLEQLERDRPPTAAKWIPISVPRADDDRLSAVNER